MSQRFVRSLDCRTGRASGHPRSTCARSGIGGQLRLRFAARFPLYAALLSTPTRRAAGNLPLSRTFKPHSPLLKTPQPKFVTKFRDELGLAV
jgi:hypothetical protein